jgi:hypothetical protein
MKLFKKHIAKMMSKAQNQTFTKRWTSIILTFSLFWVTCSYGLAFVGRGEIAQGLSNNVVKVILGVFVAYAIRGWTDTYFEKKHELEVKKMEQENE